MEKLLFSHSLVFVGVGLSPPINDACPPRLPPFHWLQEAAGGIHISVFVRGAGFGGAGAGDVTDAE